MKIVGFIFVLIFSCGIGKYFSDKECEKAAMCEEICSFLEYLARGISEKLRIDDVISRYCMESETAYIRACSKKELISYLKRTNYGGSCERLASRTAAFLAELGRSSDSMAEYKKCTRMLDEAREICKACVLECGKKNELYKKLGLICGIMVCIVFV